MANVAPRAALTGKEAEVLTLVQRRLTNAEIAAALVVSVRTVESHVSALLRKLGVANRRELAILELADAPDPSDSPNEARPFRRPIPALRTIVVGRDDAIVALSAQIGTARVSTLVGPGGVGKTTLALAVAHGQAAAWPDGVAFIDLVPARTVADVVRSIAAGLGVEGDTARSAAALAEYVAPRQTLVVLDNCEHVIDAAAAFVDAVMAAGGRAHVLATSREPLGLPDEHLVPVDPLGAAAAQLFAERAHRAEPRVDWDPADPRIVEICARLDGLPLALELAAGQLRRWSLAELSRRLSDAGNDLLTRTNRTAPRHRTMHAAIVWSYGLLDEHEKHLLRHLGVFPSTFRVDAVEGLQPLVGDDPATTLAALVDKSLVARDAAGESYHLLETIRSFALEQLHARGEYDDAIERHRRWALDRAVGSPRLERWLSGRLAARSQLIAEDTRQAFWASLDGDRLTDAVDLAMTRSFLWRNAVGCADGHEWVAALADRDLAASDRAWVHVLRSDIAQGDGDFRVMIGSAAEAARTVAGADADADALAAQFGALAHLLDITRADDALAAVMEVSTDERLTNLLRAFALVAHAGRLPAAEVYTRIDQLERSCSADGYERFIHNWAVWMHGLALRDGDLARRGIDQQYDYLRHIGLAETWLTAYSLAVSEMVDGVSGRPQLAHTLDIARCEGYRIEGDCMLALAYGAVCGGDAWAAAELLGLARTQGFNATAHHVLHGVVVDPLVRAALSPERYAEAVAQGSTRSIDAAMAEHGIAAPPVPSVG